MSKQSKKEIKFTATVLRFSSKGEKTGWWYIEVPARLANILFPENKRSFRVKGLLDDHSIKGVSLIPMGKGNFILPFNAAMRKATGKSDGQKVMVMLQLDKQEVTLNKEMMTCIKDEPLAIEYFNTLTNSHKNYFSKWVDTAKTEDTKAKRIVRIVNALAHKMNYAEMLRSGK